MSRRPTDYNEQPSGRISRTAKWWYAPDPENITPRAKKTSKMYLIILAIVLLAALLITWLWPDPEPTSLQQSPEVTAAAPALATNTCAPAEAVEYLPEQVVSTSFDSVWVRDGDMSRPTSTTGGPFEGDPYPRCFSRTPEGALYSAASFATGVLVATAAGDLKPFFEVRTSHTGNYTALISSLPALNPLTAHPQLTISGYRWNSYGPSQASLEIAFTMVSGPALGTSTATIYNLTWENNDWVLVVPGRTDVVQVITDDRAYIPWGGTG
jgi:hypothetical protein